MVWLLATYEFRSAFGFSSLPLGTCLPHIVLVDVSEPSLSVSGFACSFVHYVWGGEKGVSGEELSTFVRTPLWPFDIDLGRQISRN